MRKIGEVYYQSSDWQQMMWQELEATVAKSGLNVQKVKTVLDIGCGSGSRTRQLKSMFPNLVKAVGIDNNPAMLATAKERSSVDWIEYVLLDALNLNQLPPQKFDVIISHCSLHWVADKSTVFTHLENYLSPESYLLVGSYDRFPDLLQVIDDRLRAYFKIPATTPLPVFLYSWEYWQQFLRERKWRPLTHTIKQKKHTVNSGMPFLKYWYASSSGSAFYGHTLDKLPPDFLNPLLEEIDKKFPGSRAQHWEFSEQTLYFVAQHSA